MKRLLRSWVFWGTCLLLLPALFVVLDNVAWETRMYLCSCGSGKTESRRAFGSFPAYLWAGDPRVEAYTPSALLQECMPADHAHAWVQSWAGGGGLFGQHWNSCGRPGLPTALADTYHEDPRFREWLKSRIEAGRLSRQDVERESLVPGSASRAPFGYSR
jgi:hypothetical protein